MNNTSDSEKKEYETGLNEEQPGKKYRTAGKNWYSGKSDMWKYAHIGIQLAVLVFCGFYLGYKVDAKLKTAPLFILTGSAVGLALGFYYIYKEISVNEKK